MIEEYSKVRIVTSQHADVSPGQTGVVTKKMGTGWAVRITGLFTHANDVAHKKNETRDIFFNTDQLEEI